MLPQVQIAKRPLHFFYIVDCSGSMKEDGKIQSVNAAIKYVIPAMRDVVRENPGVDLLVRVLKFSSGAQWHVSQATPIDQFQWNDLQADGETHLGAALRLLAEQLRTPPMPDRAYPPVLILVSDGYPTDDFAGGLKAVSGEYWWGHSTRVAISIGEDAARPEAQSVFQKFIGNAEQKPFQANNAEQIMNYIKFTSVTYSRPTLKAPKEPEKKKEGEGQEDEKKGGFDF